MPPNKEVIIFESTPEPSLTLTPILEVLSPAESFSPGSGSFDSFTPPDLAAIYERLHIPIEQNLQELLVKVTGTDNLREVTVVKLKIIAREVSLQLLSIYTPLLRELNLDGSVISSLRDLGCGLKKLRVLSVPRCGLTSLDGMFALENLKELYAGHNTIEDISPCAFLPSIEVIDLKMNCLNNIDSVSFLSLCTNLKKLILEGNDKITENCNYRNKIQTFLPTLKELDGEEFEEESSPQETCETLPPPVPSILNRAQSVQASGVKNKEVLPPRAQSSRSSVTRELPNIKVDNWKHSVPSSLTSGLPLCGNVAASLRNRQKTQESPKENRE